MCKDTKLSSWLQPSWRFSYTYFALLTLTSGCATMPKGGYNQALAPPPPDYSQQAAWAARPDLRDAADLAPITFTDEQATAPMDVFFLHPTIYTGKKGDRLWNGPIDDPALNTRVDSSTIKFQATIFNGVGRVYAPRYRQAHLKAYFTKDKASAKQAFMLAYQDVAAAFQYYLEHDNQGRPFIIASHSQGTTHAKQLIRDYVEGKPLQQQLVAAYLVGIPVEGNYFTVLTPCEKTDDIQCFVSWRTWLKGHYPKIHQTGNNIVSTNPLNWTTTTTRASRDLHNGAVLKNFARIYPRVCDAEVHDGLLWVSRPRFPWSWLYRKANYHIGDFNLFYINVRENAVLRRNSYLNAQR